MTNKITNIANSHDYKRNLKKAIGKTLIEERLARNIRIETLSKQLGIPIKTIEKIELGQSDFNWLILNKLLEFYNKQLCISVTESTYI